MKRLTNWHYVPPIHIPPYLDCRDPNQRDPLEDLDETTDKQEDVSE